jgi:phage protein D
MAVIEVNEFREPFVFVSIIRGGKTSPERLDLGDRLKEVTYTDEDVKLDKLELTIDNGDGVLWDEPWMDRGNIIIFTGGYSERFIGPEKFTITTASGYEVVKISATSNIIRLAAQSKTKTWKNMSYGQIAEEIAKSSGIPVNNRTILDTDGQAPGTNPVLKIISVQQKNESDAKFLARISQRANVRFSFKGGNFIFIPKDLDWQKQPQLLYEYRNDHTGWIKKIEPKVDVKGKKAQVTAVSRDPKKKKNISATAKTGSSNKHSGTSLGRKIELVNPETKTTRLVVSKAGTIPSGQTVRRPPSSSKRLQASAEKRKDNNHRNLITMGMDSYGDPRLRAGIVITITGLAKKLTGNWYVKRAVHKWTDGGGYSVKSDLRRNALSAGTSGTTVKKKNTKKAKENKKTKLVRFEKVDPETRRTRIVFVKAK